MNTQLSRPSDVFDDKFDRIHRWYTSSDEDAKLPKPLAQQLERWTAIYGLMNKPENRFQRESRLVALVGEAFPDLSERTVRGLLADTRKFFASVDQPNQAFERVMLIAEAKDALSRARTKNDSKAENAAIKNLTVLLGADKPEEVVENKTVINILNYNPTELGGELLDEDKLQAMIKRMLSDDEKKKDDPFSDFTDVTADPA